MSEIRKQFKYMAGGTNVYGIKFDSGTGKNVKTHTERSKEISNILTFNIIEIFCKVDLAFTIN